MIHRVNYDLSEATTHTRWIATVRTEQHTGLTERISRIKPIFTSLILCMTLATAVLADACNNDDCDDPESASTLEQDVDNPDSDGIAALRVWQMNSASKLNSAN